MKSFYTLGQSVVWGDPSLDKIEKPSDWRPGMVLNNDTGDVASTDLGLDYVIRSTTYLRAQAIKQKFYEVSPADYMDIVLGEGAYLDHIIQRLEFLNASDFESAFADLDQNKESIPDVGSSMSTKTWDTQAIRAKYNYSIRELQVALATNNWDVIKTKMDSLKKFWDLGVQQISFLGSKSRPSIKGLYTLSEPTVDTSILTAAIKSMSVDEINDIVEKLVEAYFNNSNATQMPDTFVIPFSDWLGLAKNASPAFPLENSSRIKMLQSQFAAVTGNANFKISGLAYGDYNRNAGYVSTLGKNRYILYKNDPEVIRMTIPVPLIITAAGTADNYSYQGVAHGQIGSVQNGRSREIMYFDVV